MIENLQKPADHLHTMELSHPGILERSRFRQDCELHCYEPSDELKPFVVHIWTQRGMTKREVLEIQTGPNIYLFITTREAYIHGIFADTFRYSPAAHDLYVGVKFQPGGFRAFWRQDTSELAGTIMPAQPLFPQLDEAFRARLAVMSDAEIVRALEAMLRAHDPVPDKKLQEVAAVMELIETHNVERVRDIVALARTNERTLRSLFHDYVGVSPQWVLARKRLIAALTGMDNSTWTTIAATYGYSSQAHLTKVFKHATGITPSRYRKHLAGQSGV